MSRNLHVGAPHKRGLEVPTSKLPKRSLALTKCPGEAAIGPARRNPNSRKLYLKNSVLSDGAMEQKRQAEDHKERSRKPRSERGSACRYDQSPGGVSGMADEGVGSRGDNVLAPVGLDAYD